MKSKLNSPFLQMYENYMLSKDHTNKNKISNHWNVFQENFESVILDTEPWKNFLRNSLSIGFNDSLFNFSNARFRKNTGFIDGWELRNKHNFRDLVEENISDTNENNNNLRYLNYLFAFCGIDFVINNLQSNIGSPPKTYFKIDPNKHKKYVNKQFFCNNHDLGDIYHFFIINNHLKKLLDSNSTTLLEIGGGYGGLISKIKHSYKNIRCIILDLPETLAVQNYYLNLEFPNSKFLYLTDLINNNEIIFDFDFDFLLLPFWEIRRIPSKLLNLVINIRSMMEMTKDMINFYFENINRTIKDNGYFVCINRYEKNNIKLREYPFDLYWKIIFSETSKIQKHIHQLVLQRQKKENTLSIGKALSGFN